MIVCGQQINYFVLTLHPHNITGTRGHWQQRYSALCLLSIHGALHCIDVSSHTLVKTANVCCHAFHVQKLFILSGGIETVEEP